MRNDGATSADPPLERDNLARCYVGVVNRLRRGLSSYMIGAKCWLMTAAAARLLTTSPPRRLMR